MNIKGIKARSQLKVQEIGANELIKVSCTFSPKVIYVEDSVYQVTHTVKCTNNSTVPLKTVRVGVGLQSHIKMFCMNVVSPGGYKDRIIQLEYGTLYPHQSIWKKVELNLMKRASCKSIQYDRSSYSIHFPYVYWYGGGLNREEIRIMQEIIVEGLPSPP